MGRLSLYLSLHHRNRGRSPNNKRQIDRSHSGRQVRRMRSVNRMDPEEDDERQVSKKRKLDDIELMKLVDYDDDDDAEAPFELEVVSAREEEGVDVDVESLRGEFCHMSDFEIQEKIGRNRGHLSSLSLRDNGVKLRSSIKRMEAEVERRKRDKVDEGYWFLCTSCSVDDEMLLKFVHAFCVSGSGLRFHVRFDGTKV
ncbi:hypothetical protein QQ045_001514 [Rhodiola kirilowii]